ncbi:MAG: NAD(+) diphosphatase [Lachnospiraceae bacterium]|nr:NAD(+) diphosphatase [Lachnospiraceae bacterium]MDD3795679.1 NAD(+) diphosphatase [Lachnospiraceae bacterium]
MIQDISPSHFSLDYQLWEPTASDSIIYFQKGQVLIKNENIYPIYQDFIIPGYSFRFYYLFAIDTQKYFLAFSSNDVAYPLSNTAFSLQPLRFLRTLRPMDLAFAGYTAWHLAGWYNSNRFCGHCGAPMKPGADERKLVCTRCKNLVYPRINPVIIVAVHDGDRLLMTRYANRPVTWFVLIAGFIEIGETAEDTVRREVMEETGVRVKNIRYYGSQPWGIPGNLTLGYTAELDGPDKITLDTGELCEGQWICREEVPVPDDDISITSAMIHAFVNHEF